MKTTLNNKIFITVSDVLSYATEIREQVNKTSPLKFTEERTVVGIDGKYAHVWFHVNIGNASFRLAIESTRVYIAEWTKMGWQSTGELKIDL